MKFYNVSLFPDMSLGTTADLDFLATVQSNGLQLGLPELLWYQHHTQILDMQPGYKVHSKLAGTYLARSKGRGMEFDEVRHYQAGDDVRTIDWRVTARTGKTHTKLFREERERPVFILTDLSASMQFGSSLMLKAVQAGHLAALLAWHVKAQGDKLGGLVFSEQHHQLLKPLGRSKGVLRYLQALVNVQQGIAPQQGLLFSEALTEARRLVRPGSLLYVISDFSQLDDDALRHLQALQQHSEVHCCYLSDPLEQALPAGVNGVALVADAGKLKPLFLNQQLATRYQQQQRATEQQRQQRLLHLGCKWLALSAGQPLLHQLTGGAYG